MSYKQSVIPLVLLIGLACCGRSPIAIDTSIDAGEPTPREESAGVSLSSFGVVGHVGADLVLWGNLPISPDGGQRFDSLSPVVWKPGYDFVDVQLEEQMMCGRLRTGGVMCMGTDLGFDAYTRFVSVPGTEGIVQLSVGGTHACGLDTDGSVICWGRTANGQLGNGYGYVAPLELVRVGSPGQFASVLAGARGSCAIQTSGSVQCWGDGFGEFPTEIWGGQKPDEIALGGNEGTTFVCGRFGTEARCWGSEGRRGIWGLPLDGPVLTDVTSLAAGSFSVCGNTSTGELTCREYSRVAGTSEVFLVSQLPLHARPLTGLGADFGCAQVEDDLFCWGSNNFGQLGQGHQRELPRRAAYPVTWRGAQ